MKIPYTKNTEEARQVLEKEGFTPLSFFQGKEYIYPIISIRANKDMEWKEKEYSTFNHPERYHVFVRLDKFIKEVIDLY